MLITFILSTWYYLICTQSTKSNLFFIKKIYFLCILLFQFFKKCSVSFFDQGTYPKYLYHPTSSIYQKAGTCAYDACFCFPQHTPMISAGLSWYQLKQEIFWNYRCLWEIILKYQINYFLTTTLEWPLPLGHIHWRRFGDF